MEEALPLNHYQCTKQVFLSPHLVFKHGSQLQEVDEGCFVYFLIVVEKEKKSERGERSKPWVTGRISLEKRISYDHAVAEPLCNFDGRRTTPLVVQ